MLELSKSQVLNVKSNSKYCSLLRLNQGIDGNVLKKQTELMKLPVTCQIMSKINPLTLNGLNNFHTLKLSTKESNSVLSDGDTIAS